MRVGQKHSVNGICARRKWSSVAASQLFEALKQPAIDKNAPTAPFDEISRAGDGSGRAEESKRRMSLEAHFTLLALLVRCRARYSPIATI